GSRCSNAKRTRWASGMPPSARWCVRLITPIAKPRACSPRPYERMRLRGLVAVATTLVALAVVFLSLAARAEVSSVRISYGYGILYLPLMVMDREQLLEKRAKAAGL